MYFIGGSMSILCSEVKELIDNVLVLLSYWSIDVLEDDFFGYE